MSDADLLSFQPQVDMSALKGVKLNSADGLVLSLVDGRRTVDGILSAASLPRDLVLGSVKRLREAGVLFAAGQAAPKSAAAQGGAGVFGTPSMPRPPARPIDADRTTVVPFVEVQADDVPAAPPAWVSSAIRTGPPGAPAAPAAPERPRAAAPSAAPVAAPPSSPEAESEFLERLDLDPPPELDSVAPSPAPRRRKKAAPWVPKGKIETGDLRTAPIYRLLRDFYNDKKSGLLRIEAGKDWRELYMFRGHPNYVREPNPRYRFGESLERSGLVSPNDVVEAQKISEKEHLLLGLVLVELGSLTEFQIKGIVRTLVEVRVADIFSWDRGTWTFTNDEREREDLVLAQVDVSRILYFGLKSKFPWEKARIEMERDQDRFLIRNPEMEQAVPRLKLSDKELRFFEDVIDGTRTLRQVVGYSTLKGSATWQFVHALCATGFLKFQEKAHGGVESSKVGLEIDKKITTLRGATHFDVLEVHWTALEHEVQTGYERLRREYALERREISNGTPEVKDKAREVLQAVEVAYKAIHNDAQRRSYRDQVIPQDKIRFAANFNVQQAKNYKWMGDLKQAKECFDRARQLVPALKVDF